MKYKLSEIMTIIGGGTPKTSIPEYWNGDIPWLSVKDFNNDNRYVYDTEKKITQKGLENSSTKLLEKDDIIISARGTVGELAMIPFPMAFNQSCYGLRANPQIVESAYLYYLLKNTVNELKNNTHGSVFATITKDTFSAVEVEIPQIKEQIKISSILKNIDDKIALNQQINNNLEQQAQAIYTLLFIENRNPQWKEGLLSDLIAIKYGKDHKKLNDGIYPVYGSGGIMRFVEKPLYTGESVLIPRKGTLNNVMYVNGAFWSVDTMFYTEMLCPNVAKFVYHFIKGVDLASLNAGSAVPSMTTKILNAMKLYIPDNKTLQRFEEIVKPMYQMMEENEKQSLNLASIRNILLPRLMSGEIDIPLEV